MCVIQKSFDVKHLQFWKKRKQSRQINLYSTEYSIQLEEKQVWYTLPGNARLSVMSHRLGCYMIVQPSMEFDAFKNIITEWLNTFGGIIVLVISTLSTQNKNNIDGWTWDMHRFKSEICFLLYIPWLIVNRGGFPITTAMHCLSSA